MKRIENCQVNDLVRPVMDGWHSDSGGPMWQAEEYAVHQFHPDERGRLHGPHSYVMLRDGAKHGFVLNYGRFVIERLEPAPALAELATMPQDFWVSSNGEYFDNGLNRERFQFLVRASEASGIPVAAVKITKVRSAGRNYSINMANIGAANHLTRQATACLAVIIESGKSESIGEAELADLLRANASRLNTTQDPWKIFNFYKRSFIDANILTMEDS